MHPSLGPIDLSVSSARQGIFKLTYFVSSIFLYPTALSIQGLVSVIRGFLNETRRNDTDFPIEMPLVITEATLLAQIYNLDYCAHGIFHKFKYYGLPFLEAKLYPDRSVDCSEDQKSLTELTKNHTARQFLEYFLEKNSHLFNYEDTIKNGGAFYEHTKKEDKEKGIFEISGYFNYSKVYIELFVEKRIHPDYKPLIDLLKKRLEHLQYIASHYFQANLVDQKTEWEELLSCETATNKKLAFIELLEKSILRYSSRYNQLSEYIYGCITTIRDAEYNWRTYITPHLNIMKIIYKTVFSRLEFVKEFITDEKSSLTHTALKIINHQLTIWNRKATPEQVINYEFKAKKTVGSSIGAEYYPSDKPDSRWMGKLGIQELNDTDMPGTHSSLVYHGRAIEAVKEKLASDFFFLLSFGSYSVPKTRLAEIPLESVRSYFKNPRDYMEIVVNRVNQDGCNGRISKGIFFMSKYLSGYRDLFDLKNCILGRGKASFLDFLKIEKKLPEFVDIEEKIIPIFGLIELLATARLLGDTDVLGFEGKNAGFLIERDMYHRPLCVRIVKIDPGYAFDFSESNVFRNGVDLNNNLDPSKQDARNIQYAVNPGCLLPWTNLSDSQKKTYLQTFYQALNQLRNEDFINLVLGQEGFHTTPSGKKLRFVERFTQNIAASLQNYLIMQENIFINDLGSELQLSERNSFIEFVSQYGLYAHTKNTEQVRGNMPNQSL